MINDTIQTGMECVAERRNNKIKMSVSEELLMTLYIHSLFIVQRSVVLSTFTHLPYVVPPKLADTPAIAYFYTKLGENPDSLLRLFNTEGMKHVFNAFMDLEAN